MVFPDTHRGLKATLASELPGVAWQRYRTYFIHNLLTKVAKNAQNLVATFLTSLYYLFLKR
jgi:transposase-like protein